MNPQEWFETGQRQSYPEARKVYYVKGLGETPAYHVWAWIGIGLSLADRGDRVDAQDAFNFALKPDPANLYALCYLARSLNKCADSPLFRHQIEAMREVPPVAVFAE